MVCYELGYSGDGANFTTGHNNIPNDCIVVAHVHCRGDEERLSECDYKDITGHGEIGKCNQAHEYVYVTCPSESHAVLRNLPIYV